jgi:hypothetical protein
MAKVLELVELFSTPEYKAMYTLAKSRRKCVRCGKTATWFRDSLNWLEYMVSALCQDCQDYYFNRRKPMTENSD